MTDTTLPAAHSITPEAQGVKDLAIATLDSLNAKRNSLREAKSMYNEALLKNEEFVTADTAAKDAIKKRKEVKERLLKNPELAGLKEKVTEVHGEVRDKFSSFSDYLLLYEQKSGQRELITDLMQPETSTFEIVKVAKIRKKVDPNRKWAHK